MIGVKFLVVIIFDVAAHGSEQTVFFAHLMLSAAAVWTRFLNVGHFLASAVVPPLAYAASDEGDDEKRDERVNEYFQSVMLFCKRIIGIGDLCANHSQVVPESRIRFGNDLWVLNHEILERKGTRREGHCHAVVVVGGDGGMRFWRCLVAVVPHLAVVGFQPSP